MGEGAPGVGAPREGAGAVTGGRAGAKQQAAVVGVGGEAKAEAESKEQQAPSPPPPSPPSPLRTQPQWPPTKAGPARRWPTELLWQLRASSRSPAGAEA